MNKIRITKQELEEIVQENPGYKNHIKGIYHAARELKNIRDEIKKGNLSEEQYTQYSNEINEAIKNTSGYQEIKRAIIEKRNSKKQQRLESSVSKKEIKQKNNQSISRENYPVSFENAPTGVTWPSKIKKEQTNYNTPEKDDSEKNTTKEQESYDNPFISEDPFGYNNENRKLREEKLKKDREDFQKKRKSDLEKQRRIIQEKIKPIIYESNSQESNDLKQNQTKTQNRANYSGEVIEINAPQRQQEKRNKEYAQRETTHRNPEKTKKKGLIKKLAGGIAVGLAGIYIVSALSLGSGCMQGDEKKEKVMKKLNQNPQVQQIDPEKENYGHVRISVKRPSEKGSEKTYDNQEIAKKVIQDDENIASERTHPYKTPKKGLKSKNQESEEKEIDSKTKRDFKQKNTQSRSLEGVLENVEDVLWTNESEIEENDYFKKQWYGLRVEKNKKDKVMGFYLSKDFPNSENMYFLGQRKDGKIEVFREDQVYNINIRDYDAIGAGEIISDSEKGKTVVYRTGVRTDSSGKISPIRTDDIKSLSELSYQKVPEEKPEEKIPSFFRDMQDFNKKYNEKGYTRVDGYQNLMEASD